MTNEPKGLSERDARFDQTPPRRRALGARVLGQLRDAVEIVLGERVARRWWPKHPPRQANFFTAQGKPHHHGHRARLRQRFLATWPDGLPDYELLELVLFNAVPRIDVKPLAKKLLEVFGSINAVVAAPEARLLAVPGVDAKVVVQLRLAEAMARRLARAELIERCVLSSWSAVLDYCRTTMAWREREQFRVLYLDNANRLIEDVLFAEGTVNHTPVYPREVVAKGLALGAVSLILAHNHPSGDPTPSDADIEMTRRIRAACDAVNLRLIDHLIIGKGPRNVVP